MGETRSVLSTLLILFSVIFHCNDKVVVAQTVAVREVSPRCLFVDGLPMIVGFQYSSLNPRNYIELSFDSAGIPHGLNVEMRDISGKPLTVKEYDIPGMGGWPNTQVFLGTDPIEITFDLNDQFESIPPGEYDLTFRWDGENKALSESRVVVAKFESASSFMCEGIKYTEEMSAGRSRNGAYSFRCNLDIGEVSSGNEKQSWSLLAKTMKAAEPKNKFIEFKPFTSTVNLPEEGRVINAMVDYKCRLWILVECAEKQALFTWKVGHGIPIEETIGWGSPVKLSSTVASPVSVGRFLVAGRKGEQQVSSSSLSFSAVKKKKE